MLGPAIERDCYEVGGDVYDAFAHTAYRDDFFFNRETGKFLLDIPRGLTLSLLHMGAVETQIRNMSVCTFCAKDRLPSYRRDHDSKGRQRIFNFLMLSEQECGVNIKD